MINGFPADRFTFRHGSIEGRRARLREAVGEPIGRGRADRAARLVKLVVLAMGVLGVGLAVVETIAERGGEGGVGLTGAWHALGLSHG